VNAELDLDQGEYVVHVRVDREPIRSKDYLATNMPLWNQRKLASVLTNGAVSTSIVANFDVDKFDNYLPRPLELFAGRDLHEIEIESHARASAQRKLSAPSHPPTTQLPASHPDAYSVSMLSIGGFPNNGSSLPDVPPISVSHAESPVEFKYQPGVGLIPDFGDSKPAEVDADGNGQAAEIPSTNGNGNGSDHDHDQTGHSSPVLVPSQIAADSLDIAPVATSPSGHEARNPNAPRRPRVNTSTEAALGVGPIQAILQDLKEVEVHSGIRCNGCGADPLVGVRYKCLEITCPDYDLCSNCFRNKVHGDTHRMLAIASPQDAGGLSQEAEADSENEIAVGLRVYSKKDCPTTIKGQLRHGKLIRWRS